jgi:hypothetical protein
MTEGLKADEKKDLSQFQNGMGARLGMEMYQSESIRIAQGTKSVLAFCSGRTRLICAAALPGNAKRRVGSADQAGNVVANAQA